MSRRWQRLVNWAFGYDYFIAYAWVDGRAYAVELARQLDARGFECFLDSASYALGDDWKRVGAWTLRRTSYLLLLGSPGALRSRAVLREVRLFRRTGRRVIAIDCGQALTGARGPSRLLEELPDSLLRLDEELAALPAGAVRPGLAEKVQESFHRVRQRDKRLRLATALAATLALLTAGLGLAAGLAWRARREAERSASQVRSHALLLTAEAALVGEPEVASLVLGEIPPGGLPDSLQAIAALQRIATSPLPRDVLRGHGGAIHAAVFSPDGRVIASASEDRTARLWPADGSGPPRVLAHPTAVYSLAFDGAAGALLTVGSDGRLRRWSLNGRLLGERSTTRLGRSVFLAPDGSAAIGADDSHALWRWDARRLEQPAEPLGQGAGELDQVVFGKRSSTFVTLDGDSPARLFQDGSPGRLLGQLWAAAAAVDEERQVVAVQSFTGRGQVLRFDGTLVSSFGDDAVLVAGLVARAVAITPDGSHLLSATQEGTIRVRPLNGSEVDGLLTGNRGTSSIAFDPAGERAITGSLDGQTRVFWWRRGGAAPVTLQGSPGGVSPDAASVVTLGPGNALRLWWLDGSREPQLLGERTSGRYAQPAVLDGGGKAVLGLTDEAVLWQLADASPAVEVARIAVAGEDVDAAAFHPDGELLALGTSGGRRLLVRRGNGYRRQELDRSPYPVEVAAFARRRVAFGNRTGGVGLFHLPSGAAAGNVRSGGRISALAFTRDGRRLLVAAADGTVRLWDVDRLVTPLWSFAGHAAPRAPFMSYLNEIQTASLSADERLVITAGGDGTARVLDAESGRQLAKLEHSPGRGVTDAVFSSDGAFVATAGEDGNARLWARRGSGWSARILPGGTGHFAVSVDFSSDSRFLVVATRDGLVRLWSVGGGDAISFRNPRGDQLIDARITADLQHVIATDTLGQPRVWRFGARAALAQLQRATRGCMSAEQRQRYLAEGEAEAASRARACSEQRRPGTAASRLAAVGSRP